MEVDLYALRNEICDAERDWNYHEYVENRGPSAEDVEWVRQHVREQHSSDPHWYR